MPTLLVGTLTLLKSQDLITKKKKKSFWCLECWDHFDPVLDKIPNQLPKKQLTFTFIKYSGNNSKVKTYKVTCLKT